MTDPRDDRSRVIIEKGQRVDGTCEWILSNTAFESWRSSVSQLLWLSGGPGKGKTMISIFLTEELERSIEQSPNTTLVYFFCKNNDQRRNTALAVLRGILFHLLLQKPKLIKHLIPDFELRHKSAFDDFETLWRIFKAIIMDPDNGTIFCILDGLDEIDQDSLEILLKQLTELFSPLTKQESSFDIRLMLVSRQMPSMLFRELSEYPNICLDHELYNEPIQNDLQLFISSKISKLSKIQSYPDDLRSLVENFLLERAEGTFLWAALVSSELNTKVVSEVEQVLVSFPRGLNMIFRRILLQIRDDKRDIAALILRWVVTAVRPLTLEELSEVLTRYPKVDWMKSSNITWNQRIQDYVSFCGAMVKCCDGVITTVHQSAKEYLQREEPDSDPRLELFRIKPEEANLELALTCFSYLEIGGFACGPVSFPIKNGTPRFSQAPLQKFPLLHYASINWPEHVRVAPDAIQRLNITSNPFWKKESSLFQAWWQSYWESQRNSDDAPTDFSLLHFASFFGLLLLAERILSKSWKYKLKLSNPLNRRDSKGYTPLLYAVGYHHLPLVQLLLSRGADLNIKDNDGYTVLDYAWLSRNTALVSELLCKGAKTGMCNGSPLNNLMIAMYAGEDIVKVFVDNGTNFAEQDKDGLTALHFAASNGDIDYIHVVQLLIENGNSPDSATRDDGWTPLHTAASYGHDAYVSELLKNGSDIGFKDHEGKTALHLATIKGHTTTVQLILDNEANIEDRDNSCFTSLHWAAMEGHHQIVELLLEREANLEAKGAFGMTPLHYASLYKRLATAKVLLKHGANVNQTDDKYGMTPLHWTIGNRNEHLSKSKTHEAKELVAPHIAEMILLLLDAGANPEARDKSDTTPLMYAFSCGYWEKATVLLNNTAELQATDKEKALMLYLATREGQVEILKPLVGKGVNITAPDQDGRTALHWASLRGHLTVISLLLDYGADLEAKYMNGVTPLHLACSKGQVKAAELLLSMGAKVEATNENKMSALQVAVMYNKLEVTQLLLNWGADLNITEENGLNALHLAAIKGHSEQVELLLSYGADPEAKDNTQRTALTIAKQLGWRETAKVLKDWQKQRKRHLRNSQPRPVS